MKVNKTALFVLQNLSFVTFDLHQSKDNLVRYGSCQTIGYISNYKI